jgi:hypothetical protein
LFETTVLHYIAAIKNDRNSSFDGMLGSLAGSIILIVIVFIVLATRRYVCALLLNISILMMKTR